MTGFERDMANDLKKLREANEELARQQKAANILKMLEMQSIFCQEYGDVTALKNEILKLVKVGA